MSWRKMSSVSQNNNASGMGPEYLEAVSVMNDDTMTKLCRLLQDNTDPTDGLAQMTDILHSCEKAAKVIAEQAPAPVLPGSLAAPGLRLAPRSNTTKGKRMVVPPSRIPSKRFAMGMDRQKSDTSTTTAVSAEPPPGYAKQFLAKLNGDDTKPKRGRVAKQKSSTSLSSSPLPPKRTQPSRSNRK